MPSVDLSPPTSTPDIVADWWRDEAPPWTRPVDDRPVDTARTAGLRKLAVGNSVVDRVRTKGQMPLQVANWRNTTVNTFPRLGTYRVPLPNAVWLIGNTDQQWFGVDPEQGIAWEVSSLRTGALGWWAKRVCRLDMNEPWQTQRGVAGGGIPIWAMTPTNGQLKAGPGGIDTALNFVVGGDYDRTWVPWLSKSDGTLTGHPLRAGERLRLTEEAYQKLLGDAQTADDFAVLWALANMGAVVNDQTTPTAGHALRLPVGANVTIRLTILDFEVVAQ